MAAGSGFAAALLDAHAALQRLAVEYEAEIAVLRSPQPESDVVVGPRVRSLQAADTSRIPELCETESKAETAPAEHGGSQIGDRESDGGRTSYGHMAIAADILVFDAHTRDCDEPAVPLERRQDLDALDAACARMLDPSPGPRQQASEQARLVCERAGDRGKESDEKTVPTTLPPASRVLHPQCTHLVDAIEQDLDTNLEMPRSALAPHWVMLGPWAQAHSPTACQDGRVGTGSGFGGRGPRPPKGSSFGPGPGPGLLSFRVPVAPNEVQESKVYGFPSALDVPRFGKRSRRRGVLGDREPEDEGIAFEEAAFQKPKLEI